MSRLERIQVITDILNRWGKLDKSTIDQRLSAKMGVELTSALKRAIYRDLDSLVNSNRAIVEYYTRDGAIIDDYDSDVHKNVISKWHIVGAENKIIGESLLRGINSHLHCPSFLRNDLSLSTGNTDTAFNTRHIYFTFLGKFMCLKVNLESVPVKILVTRNKGEIVLDEISAVEEKFGKRCVIFKIPAQKVSSFDPKRDDKNGHLLITINEDTLEFEDLGSSNGTKLYKLSMEVADEFRTNGALLGAETMSVNWTGMIQREIQDGVEVKKHIEEPPVLLNLADEHFLLIV